MTNNNLEKRKNSVGSPQKKKQASSNKVRFPKDLTSSPLTHWGDNSATPNESPKHRGRMSENQLKIERDKFISELKKLTSADEKSIKSMMDQFDRITAF